jgi:hypothetical protein
MAKSKSLSTRAAKRGKRKAPPTRTPSRAALKAASMPKPEETSKKSSPDWMARAAERIADAEKAETELKATIERKEAVLTKGGRPSKYEPWMCDAVVDFGRIGMEVVEFAVKLNVATSTLYKWAQETPAFSDALARAREASEAFHAARIREQAGMPSGATNMASYLSYMGRRFKSWREKQEHEHEVGDGLAELLGMIDGGSRSLGPKD